MSKLRKSRRRERKRFKERYGPTESGRYYTRLIRKMLTRKRRKAILSQERKKKQKIIRVKRKNDRRMKGKVK